MTFVTRGFILFQWFNFEDFLSVYGQFPVGHQIITVDFDPRLNQFHSAFLDAAFDDSAFGNSDNRLFTLLFNVDMWTVVFPGVEKIQGYDNPVEHGNDRHDVSILEIPFFFNFIPPSSKVGAPKALPILP